jgi:hypothetical protein
MDSIRFRAPSAAAAFILVDLLEDHCEATAAKLRDGTWQIAADLTGEARSTVPQLLDAARDWLARCGLASTSITGDEETHLLEDVATRSRPDGTNEGHQPFGRGPGRGGTTRLGRLSPTNDEHHKSPVIDERGNK